jgi:hypothetical protein
VAGTLAFSPVRLNLATHLQGKIVMKLFLPLSAVTLVTTMLVSSCSGEQQDPQQALAEQRLEIDQLTNAVGRLEFRVSQLEDQLGAATLSEATSAPVTAREPGTPPIEIEDSNSDNKRYDLAPVE